MFAGTLSISSAMDYPFEGMPSILAIAMPPAFGPLLAITINGNGSITPSTAPIIRTGNIYVLTGNISDYYYLEIRCGNITLDGAGYTLEGKGGYYTSPGIDVETNGVTVKNINIQNYGGGGLDINGSFNTVVGSVINSGVFLDGSYNNVTGNTIEREVGVSSEYNNITENNIQFVNVRASASYNNFVANRIGLVILDGNYNVFYLNDFYHDPRYIHKILTRPPCIGNRFDNGTVGNYWSDYNGTDMNLDGIGDTPYKISGNLQDNYPFMTPYNSSSATLMRLVYAVVAAAAIIAIVAIAVKLKKRRQQSVEVS